MILYSDVVCSPLKRPRMHFGAIIWIRITILRCRNVLSVILIAILDIFVRNYIILLLYNLRNIVILIEVCAIFANFCISV